MNEYRLATEDEIPQVVALMRHFVDNMATDTYKKYCSDRHMAKQVENLIRSPSGYVSLFLKDGEPKGVMVGSASWSLFSNVITAEEIMWWVEPTYRGKGLPMIKMFEDWAKSIGAAVVVMSGFDDLSKLYLAKGFEKKTTHYVKEVLL